MRSDVSADPDLRQELTSLVHLAARYLDDRDYDGFLGLFTDQGIYKVTTVAPELPDKMTWMEYCRDELAERIRAMARHEWEIARFDQSRLLSVDIVSGDEDAMQTSTTFAIYHTDDTGRSSCYAVGRYEDAWQRVDTRWLIASREIVLKTRALHTLSPLPL